MVQGAAVPTSPTAAVAVAPGSVMLGALEVPPNATQVGTVQAHSTGGTIDLIVPEFVNQVARLGGNFGKIDDVTTHFDMVARSVTQSYSCGTTNAPRTCTRTSIQNVELATTRILGRAFKVPK